MFQANYFSRLLSLALVVTVGLASLSGCKDNPGNWAPDKVATKVSESLEISGLSLTTTGNGLEGSGKRADGETITVVVKLDPASSKFTWDAKGDRGFVESGSYSLTQ